MKTIRMPNRASIVLFLKILIAVVICVPIIFFVADVIYIRYIEFSPIVFETNEEIVEMFEANVEDFDKMVELIEETGVVWKLNVRYLTQKKITFPTGDALSNPKRQLKGSGFVTKAQLKEIIEFFEKYNVHYISSSVRGEPHYDFEFFSKTHCVSFLYVDSNEENITEIMTKAYEDFGYHIFQISEHWYCTMNSTQD